MVRSARQPLYSAVLFWLGLAGLLSGLAGLAPPSGAQASRVLQVWPDYGRGVASGRLEGVPIEAAVQVFPFGVCRTVAGDVVYARTYLHFPLDLFPPGTDVLHATLYVYVDSSSGTGEATVGAYRVLDPWREEYGAASPASWPMLLTSPIATSVARFGAAVPVPVSTPATGALPKVRSMFYESPLATATFPSSPLLTPTPTLILRPTDTPVATHTPTATLMPTATLTPVSQPTLTLVPTSPASPLPTPTPLSPSTEPVVSLRRVAGTWLTWDVTALMRAWMAGEVPDDGLALAPAPDPDADPETAGDLLLARQLTANDPTTRPYLIVEFEVRPVTPTPVPVLPAAGSQVGWGAAGLVLVGVALMIVGLGVRRARSLNKIP
jgi:hypothetical protein